MPPPNPSPSTITEADLITRVKAQQDSGALTTLVESHTGIYLQIVNRYASVYPNTIRRDDLADDKLFNIYQFVLDYKPERGTKLSTYIGDRTHWMCKTLLKQEERNPVRAGTYGPSGAYDLGTAGDTYTMAGGASVTLADEKADVVEEADRELALEEVMAAAASACKDERFLKILTLRHFGSPPQTSLSWRQIGERLGLSHERARVIYNQNLALVREHLAERT